MLRRLSFIFVLVCGGCATVHPSETLRDPVPVYLADYGVHSSLMLPTGGGVYVEYCFGDWAYAVENHDLLPNAFAALTISQQSALGRRYMDKDPQWPGPSVPNDVTPRLRSMTCIMVDYKRAWQLRVKLDERFREDSQLHPPQINPLNGIAYVKDSQHYGVANNCNMLTAACLRELGCEVDGFVMFSNFRVSEQSMPPMLEVSAHSPAALVAAK